jgi:hypothetical protein
MDASRMNEETLNPRQLNLQRKKLKCLGCAKEMVTDRCHRFCRVCQRRNRRNGDHLPKVGRLGRMMSTTELS